MTEPSERPAGYDELNRYTRIIVDEAQRRGIDVTVVGADRGELRLEHRGRVVHTMESLSQLTSAVAFKRCDDKLVTREVLGAAGLRVPPGRAATFDAADEAFLATWGDIVVKPAKGEQGWGITVGVTDAAALRDALDTARAICPSVVLEQRCEGEDLRMIVIDGEVVAASVRRPPEITGDGVRPVRELVVELSDARGADTDGAADIPLDEVTLAVLGAESLDFESVLEAGVTVVVRRTANVHTGGTIVDVTDRVHPTLLDVARRAAEAIEIPVVGLDLMVPDLGGDDYVIIEANEQPGLANHEPRPTVERFLDLVVPSSRD